MQAVNRKIERFCKSAIFYENKDLEPIGAETEISELKRMLKNSEIIRKILQNRIVKGNHET
jgi:hypothetical protein